MSPNRGATLFTFNNKAPRGVYRNTIRSQRHSILYFRARVRRSLVRSKTKDQLTAYWSITDTILHRNESLAEFLWTMWSINSSNYFKYNTISAMYSGRANKVDCVFCTFTCTVNGLLPFTYISIPLAIIIIYI